MSMTQLLSNSSLNFVIKCSALSLITILSIASLATAENITYYIIPHPERQDGGVLSGSITTDGTFSDDTTLTPILSWEFTISQNGETWRASSSDENACTDSGGLIATPTYLKIPEPLSNYCPYMWSTGCEIGILNTGSLRWQYVYDNSGDDEIWNRAFAASYFEGGDLKIYWAFNNLYSSGGDWIIATVTPVPEPNSLILLYSFVICSGTALGFRWFSKRR